jgi:pimeloyl-ACP methyl ester carboxylesterase
VFSALTVETKFIENDGRKIAYRQIGRGEPLIMCNRFRGILDDWDPLFLDELAKNYTVITFDYSGIGLSSLPHPDDSLMEVQDIADIADALSLDTFNLAGWSHGGKVAQAFAIRAAGRVKNLILLGTGPIGKNGFPPEPVFFDHALKPVNDFEDEVILFFEPRYTASVEAAKLSRQRMSARQGDKDVYVTPDKFQKYFNSVAMYNSIENGLDTLISKNIPTLALSGEHDIVFPIENWYALTRKCPSLQIIMLPQAGHGPQSQYPVLAASYIHNFIGAGSR